MHPAISTDRLGHARGALLGLACGDAVGTTVEFKPRNSFAPMTDMVGGGPFHLKPGQWTDDTSMALCLSSSLIEKGFDPLDQMNRYVRWYEHGYMSSNGRCFDIGNATYDALMTFKRTGNPLAGSISPDSAGNGCTMRLAPIPIRYLDIPELALDLCVEQSRTTHQAPECLMACRLLGEVLIRALQGRSKDEVLAPSQQVLRLSPGLKSVASGRYKTKTMDQIRGSGYVVQSLEAAFWCFERTDNFKDCVLLAANLGDDADTTAAVVGQIAGAYYGQSGIPVEWLEKLTMADEIGVLAEQLVKGVCDSKSGFEKSHQSG
ncbi:ADP-ribosylglycohydrolase family protein [Polaromonas sp.]|uniref:ADP-ribosylglycohydrolase family protein n=1 Tax=Polaromonas sp. TaxID=1869339 RepID=UPI0013BB37B5|nr:ADP-ribosylglycohydrolase family protein [Polaromonas sp.]NDP63452.1 ADP-ribosylglycohydrolase family protein [Polaromonas sp.]